MSSRFDPTMLLLLLIFVISLKADALANKPFIRKLRGVIPGNYPFSLPWYEDGLDFSCTGCGKCCKVDGDVWLAPEEVLQITQHLGLNITEFRGNFIKAEVLPTDGNEEESWMCLKRDEGACIFLGEGNMCKIYEHRPIQCQTYPFWPSLLSDPEAWSDEAVLPDDVTIDEGSSERHWSPELGGCEGIAITTTNEMKEGEESDSDDEHESTIIQREEIRAKMKSAKRHWKRFPADEIKQSTWYL